MILGLTSATGLTWSGLGLDLDAATGQAVFSYDTDENIQMPLLLTCGERVSTCVKIQNLNGEFFLQRLAFTSLTYHKQE